MPVADEERYSVFVYRDPTKPNEVDFQVLLNGQGCNVSVHGTGMSPFIGNGGSTEVKCDTTSYLYNDSGLRDKYVLINNGGLGLLTNRETATALDSQITATPKFEALIFVQGVQYDVA